MNRTSRGEISASSASRQPIGAVSTARAGRASSASDEKQLDEPAGRLAHREVVWRLRCTFLCEIDSTETLSLMTTKITLIGAGSVEFTRIIAADLIAFP